MHPTIDEQLAGIARLIERAAERDPEDPALQRLQTAAGTLRRIAGSWAEILPFLTWDNDAMKRLLEDHRAALSKAQQVQLAALAADAIDPLCARSAHERNKALRGLLAELIQDLPSEASQLREAVGTHLKERIAREPSAGRRRRS